jgi:cell division protein FtsZ
MTINLHLPAHSDTLKPKITVVGVGGAGGNAVNNMIAANLEGVEFVMANTDAQALESAMTDRTVQLGVSVTRGLGAGANPQTGRAAAEEAIDDIADHIQGSNMVFITAGMGGGTGTGAAPVIAQLAREQGILTVGVVTKPFQFEGTHRMRLADSGIEELQQYVDTLIVIPNQNLFRIANEKTTFAEAFRMADEVLHSGVRGVTDLMVKPGLVNLDFADIRAVMSEMGKAMMGTGEATGDKRAVDAAESAISNPLLDDVSLRGARAVLINITGGPDMTLFEVDEAANRIREEVDNDANIIFGSTFSDTMEGQMRVSVVATGIEQGVMSEQPTMPLQRHIQQVRSAPAAQPSVAASQAAARRNEVKRERTAAEIVRESGTASVSEMAKLAVQRSRVPSAPETPVGAAVNGQAEMFAETGMQRDEASMEWEQVEPDVEVRRRPFRLSGAEAEPKAPQQEMAEMEEAVRPAFISPKAEMPAQRAIPVSEPQDEDEHGGRGFLRKIAGVGSRAFGSRAVEYDEDYDDEADDEARAKVVKNDAAREDEEYLDIPAFLRRQAN